MLFFDCVVIGAGVAGMTSAIYLKRYNVNVLLLEKNAPGGQMTQTPRIENYPGYISIDGATLALTMYEQITKLEIAYQYGNVIHIEDKGNEKIIYTETEEIHTKSIIVAIGRKPRKLGLKGENQLVGKGISWCATCDGMFYKNQNVAIVGGGNSALEEALFLSEICNQVDILYRGEKLRADKILQERILERQNIKVHYQTIVEELFEERGTLKNIQISEKNERKELSITGLFIYIGFEPDTEMLRELGLILEQGYAVVNQKMETNIKGIYAVGDVIKKDLYQLTTAIGEAAIAANQVKNYLTEKRV